jgi:predicted phosphodiesterase
MYIFIKFNDHYIIRMKLIPIGDVHYGHRACNVQLFEKTIKRISRTGAKTILMGDLLESSTRRSIGSRIYDQEKLVGEQIEYMVKVLKPLADRNKIIGIIEGNHEQGIYRETGLSVTKIIARELGIPYFKYTAKFKFCGKKFVAVHGSGGSTKITTKLKKLLDLNQIYDADVYLMGHYHDIIHYHDFKGRNYYLTGSFLDYSGTYADMKNLLPGTTGTIIIENGEYGGLIQ